MKGEKKIIIGDWLRENMIISISEYKNHAFGLNFLATLQMIVIVLIANDLKWYFQIPLLIIGWVIWDYISKKSINRWIKRVAEINISWKKK